MLHLQLSERDVEQLLAGDQPQGRSDLAEVARFVARLRALSDIESSPPMDPRLLAELDVAEAERTTVETPKELEHWRELARRRAHSAKRRWRLVGAAAMIACLGGVLAAAQVQGSDSTEPSVEVDDDQVVGPTSTGSPTTRPEVSNGPKTEPTTTVPPAPEQPAATPQDQPATQGQGQVEAPGPPNVAPSDEPPWVQCGADPRCWMTVWPEFVPGSD